MKLIDIIRLLIENKDLILQIIQFLKDIGVIKGGDGVVTLACTVDGVAGTTEVSIDQAAALAEQAGFGENFVEIVKLLLANWDSVMKIIDLFRGK